MFDDFPQYGLIANGTGASEHGANSGTSDFKGVRFRYSVVTPREHPCGSDNVQVNVAFAHRYDRCMDVKIGRMLRAA